MASERRARATQALQSVGLSSRMHHVPSKLSGGERQRVAIARAIVNRPAIVLADEPTGNLDTKSGVAVMDLVRDLHSEGNTVIIIEHNLDVIRNADWLIDLGPEGGEDGGRVVAQGTPEQVAKVKKSYTGQALAHYFKSTA